MECGSELVVGERPLELVLAAEAATEPGASYLCEFWGLRSSPRHSGRVASPQPHVEAFDAGPPGCGKSLCLVAMLWPGVVVGHVGRTERELPEGGWKSTAPAAVESTWVAVEVETEAAHRDSGVGRVLEGKQLTPASLTVACGRTWGGMVSAFALRPSSLAFLRMYIRLSDQGCCKD